MNFNAEHLTQAFELMALGMGGVFRFCSFIKSIPAR